MARVTVCDRCGLRLDGDLSKHQQSATVKVDLSSLEKGGETIEMDLCLDDAEEFMEHVKAFRQYLAMVNASIGAKTG